MSDPRECAKALIRPYVQRGDRLEHLQASSLGYAGADCCVQIGGYAVNGNGSKNPKDWTSTKLTCNQIAVTRLAGQDCLSIFSLSELYHELRCGDQLSLF